MERKKKKEERKKKKIEQIPKIWYFLKTKEKWLSVNVVAM